MQACRQWIVTDLLELSFDGVLSESEIKVSGVRVMVTKRCKLQSSNEIRSSIEEITVNKILWHSIIVCFRSRYTAALLLKLRLVVVKEKMCLQFTSVFVHLPPTGLSPDGSRISLLLWLFNLL